MNCPKCNEPLTKHSTESFVWLCEGCQRIYGQEIIMVNPDQSADEPVEYLSSLTLLYD